MKLLKMIGVLALSGLVLTGCPKDGKTAKTGKTAAAKSAAKTAAKSAVDAAKSAAASKPAK